jgi:hypothetical protein
LIYQTAARATSGGHVGHSSQQLSVAAQKRMFEMNSKWSSLSFAVVTTVVASLGATPARAQTFAGSATGVQITVPATGTVIRAATGTLSIGGGGAHAALLVGDVPGSATGGVVTLAAGTLHSAIVGLIGTAGGASMSNVNLTVSGNQITADFLMARSSASCSPAVAGNSQLQNLVVNGQPVTVTGSPNQTISLPNGTLVLNKQQSSIGSTSASLTVDALNVTTTDAITHQQLANVVLGTTNAQIDCSGGAPPNETWTTGGGWIYGVSGGVQADSTVKGHLVYQDHGIDFRVKDTVIDSVVGGCTTTIHGYDRSGADEIEFTVTVTDSTQSGDTFSIQATGLSVPNGLYSATGPLQGGNIQVHDQACP